MPKRVFKDEARDAEQKTKKRADSIAVVEAVLGRIISKPSVWDAPDMDNIKSMVCQIGRDRERFPLPLDEEEDEESISSGGRFSLTSGVGKSLYGRENMDLLDVILQVTAASSENRMTKVDGKEIPHRLWKLNAVDGDGTVVTVRLDSTLNSQGSFLTPGSIVHVTSGFPVYLNYGDLYDMQCAIVLRAFRVIGRRPVPEACKGAPVRLSVKNISGGDDAGNDLGGDTTTGDDGADNVSNDSMGACDCNGHICSKHGISFSICIAKCVPVENLSLEKVARECVFVTKDLKDMAPNNLRFLCYYYYATSVYQFHGKGNRVDLPDCLVNVIRETFPDEN
mmetsp:Transcript_54120/g.114984  ORF Transcript_54120/g.114984 Transcript_54120/m.114984 type:complete len:337 (+) Transcript_54120:163-1173(+)|eukprot:CAMPEP_0172533614 /NCGR_PEP_ID=MMETSP1067-20121228/6252_1 /TAXON_ID=265564 ORGANISM="Thalassiosira punctigera, Strain Tpunct2005C2" /NCGR_SAMPLE_ID=MMETSP1067 /ASSEMBLY_ACC=CAM_ASM_000444 /LENGTH=336 /DNA_ID=CAMNT_0013318269 /DNA_START=96 /DNA_END=1106 /DNA_ORIENTATION=+